MGSEELWDRSRRPAGHVLVRGASVQSSIPGDGAFYGPKIDFHIRDAIGRSWQCATVQLDFQMPENSILSYAAKTAASTVPVVIHRAVYGSIDRFFGILTEHYAGAFPLWLAPVQAKVIPVSEADAGSRPPRSSRMPEEAGLDGSGVHGRQEKLGYKIREAQLEKVPYMLVLGEAERGFGDSIRSQARRGISAPVRYGS